MNSNEPPLRTLYDHDCEARIYMEDCPAGGFMYRIVFLRRLPIEAGVDKTPRFRGKDLAAISYLAQEAELFLEGRYDEDFDPEDY